MAVAGSSRGGAQAGRQQAVKGQQRSLGEGVGGVHLQRGVPASAGAVAGPEGPGGGGGCMIHLQRGVNERMNKGTLLDLDTWIVPGEILTGKPPPGSGKQLQTSRYRGVDISPLLPIIEAGHSQK